MVITDAVKATHKKETWMNQPHHPCRSLKTLSMTKSAILPWMHSCMHCRILDVHPLPWQSRRRLLVRKKSCDLKYRTSKSQLAHLYYVRSHILPRNLKNPNSNLSCCRYLRQRRGLTHTDRHYHRSSSLGLTGLEVQILRCAMAWCRQKLSRVATVALL